jgi:ATP-dependent Clp protease protease subunit
MPKQWFSMQARAGVGEIAIYDEIGAGGISARDFHEKLKALGAVNSIRLSINSPGGSVFDGLAIHNMLARHAARVVVTIDGVAASMASAVAMSGDEIVMPKNSMLMLHNPTGVALGDADTMGEMADALRRMGQSLIGIYAARSKQPHEKIQSMMNATTWLNADEAVALGFADRVEQPVKIAATFDLARRYGNVPAAPSPAGLDAAAIYRKWNAPRGSAPAL